MSESEGTHRRLERSTIEAYVSLLIGLLVGIVPMSFWLEVALLFVLYAMAGDVILHSRLTASRSLAIKVGLFPLAAGGIWAFFGATLASRYAAERVGAKLAIALNWISHVGLSIISSDAIRFIFVAVLCLFIGAKWRNITAFLRRRWTVRRSITEIRDMMRTREGFVRVLFPLIQAASVVMVLAMILTVVVLGFTTFTMDKYCRRIVDLQSQNVKLAGALHVAPDKKIKKWNSNCADFIF